MNQLREAQRSTNALVAYGYRRLLRLTYAEIGKRIDRTKQRAQQLCKEGEQAYKEGEQLQLWINR